MIPVRGYAAARAGAALKPFAFERRSPVERDVVIDILYCGVCHSDIHSARGEWGNDAFPLVPGHEIVGRVSGRGAAARRFKVGDLVGVGCFVESCGTCPACRAHLQQHCVRGAVFTYGGKDRFGRRTQGGYSTRVVVDENYVLRIPPGLPPAKAAPLLCAGITTYSPLRRWKIGPGKTLGVVGLGGLGHMAVKLGASMGARVAVISTSPKKAREARRLGARDFLLSTDKKAMAKRASSLDVVIDTVSADHPLEPLFDLLKREGTLVMVGASPTALAVPPFALILGRKQLAGSLIGGLRETQEMLDFCARRKITPDIELIAPAEINRAYGRVVKGDVRYRFVIDCGKF
ncbi:MAG: NAD(P)-dependent alcohol dehydrogenase [Elusimicrobia bacterium]|jgi:uncharacterized zinc-type alcohol dehydrogenase-like protein|nr:MAG: NAD(P)-dependent alcohol dehydrogenase [Elusimicrobiota bacterium]